MNRTPSNHCFSGVVHMSKYGQSVDNFFWGAIFWQILKAIIWFWYLWTANIINFQAVFFWKKFKITLFSSELQLKNPNYCIGHCSVIHLSHYSQYWLSAKIWDSHFDCLAVLITYRVWGILWANRGPETGPVTFWWRWLSMMYYHLAIVFVRFTRFF